MNPEDYNPINGTEIKLVSLSGELIQYLRNSDNSGEVLKCKVEQIKNGGVNEIVFSVDKNTNIPVFPGLLIDVYKDGEIFATGYSDTVPKPQSESPEVEVKCLGFMHKLKNKTINKTYSATTLSAIIADLEPDLNEVDIFYDVSKITLPGDAVTDLVFDDKTLLESITIILQIANEDYNNAQYRWFIDNERTLNFSLIPAASERGLFEGFNYQAPEVEEDDSKIINRVLIYKTDEVDTKILSYVTTLNDTDSQGKYGIRDKKIVFPDFVDNTTLNRLAAGVLEKFKDPKTKFLIENLEGVDFPFSFYNLSGKIEESWQLMSECDSFDGWDLSNVTDTIVSLSTERVLTGRRSIKAITTDGSLDEYIQLDLETPIYGPLIFRFYLYLEEAMNLEVVLIDTNDVEYPFNLGVAELKLDVDKDVSTEKHLEVNDGTLHGVSVNLQVAYTDDWLKIESPIDVFAIKAVKIIFRTDAASIVFFDRLELKARSYSTNKLTLEKIESELNKDYALSKAEFGDIFETLHDTIKEKVKDGDIALSIVAKQ